MSTTGPSIPQLTACTAAEWDASTIGNDGNYTWIHCMTREDTIGFTVNTAASFISMISVILILSLVLRNYIRYIRYSPPGDWRLIEVPMDLYMLCLFTSDFFQALGTFLDVKWLHDGKVITGHYCNAQGIIQVLGETSVAMITSVIALSTFASIWWGKQESIWAASVIMAGIYLYVALFVLIANETQHSKHYESPSPYWCWLGAGNWNMLPKIFGEYLWFWTTMLVSISVYIPLFFWSRGNITVNQERLFSFRVHSRGVDASTRHAGRSLAMLLYVFVYVAAVFPLSVVRWITFVPSRRNSIHPAATFAVDTIYELSGFYNVILFIVARPNLLLFTPRGQEQLGGAPSIVSSPRPNSNRSIVSMREMLSSNADFRQPMRHVTLDDDDSGWDVPQSEHEAIPNGVAGHGPTV